MNDHNNSEQRYIIKDAKPMRTPMDVRLQRADQFAEVMWWILFVACLGVLLYGVFA